MGGLGPRPLVLDTGGLIALEKGDRLAREILRRAVDSGAPVVVPAAVLAQAWRDPCRQARLARLIASETTQVDVLDEETAKVVGAICGRSGTSDIADASVILSARVHNAVVLTGDAADLLRIDPALEMAVL